MEIIEHLQDIPVPLLHLSYPVLPLQGIHHLRIVRKGTPLDPDTQAAVRLKERTIKSHLDTLLATLSEGVNTKAHQGIPEETLFGEVIINEIFAILLGVHSKDETTGLRQDIRPLILSEEKTTK